jgi:hypothetical protein
MEKQPWVIIMQNYWAADEEGAIIWRLLDLCLLPALKHASLCATNSFCAYTFCQCNFPGGSIHRTSKVIADQSKKSHGEMLFGERALGSSYIFLWHY